MYYKKADIQKLKGFFYTARTGKVSTAAQILQVGQSAVTLQIQALEKDLGVQLFNRHCKPHTLTEDGKLLLELVTPLIHEVDHLYDHFHRSRKKEVTILRIASNQVSILYLLPQLLSNYHAKYPHVQFNIRNRAYDDGVELMATNEVDLLLYPCQTPPPGYEFIPIAHYDPILMTTKDHPLAQKENLTLEDVAKYNLLRIDPHLITLPLFEEVLETHNIRTNTEFENADWEILKKFVQAGLGVAIISNICIEPNDPVLIGRPLHQYFPKMIYGFLIKKDGYIPEHVQQFLDMISTQKP